MCPISMYEEKLEYSNILAKDDVRFCAQTKYLILQIM